LSEQQGCSEQHGRNGGGLHLFSETAVISQVETGRYRCSAVLGKSQYDLVSKVTEVSTPPAKAQVGVRSLS
jgi:hypothetical protein